MNGSSTAVGSGSVGAIDVASSSVVSELVVDPGAPADEAGTAASNGTVDPGASEGWSESAVVED